MWNTPTDKELSKIPALYSTENTPLKEKIIQLHFFIGGSDWYIAEYDEKSMLFFGYSILNGDTGMAEWGYISFDELKGLKQGFIQVDRDLHFTPCKAQKVMAK